MNLKCDICFFKFDLETHRPKSLPCGHTICMNCVQNSTLGRKCPTCRQAFLQRRPEDLPDTIIVVRLLENEDASHCKKPKIEDPVLEQLQRGADAGRKVVKMLRLVVPLTVESLNRQLESSVAQLCQVEEALERRVQREAAGDVGTTSDAVEEPLQLAEQLEASHRLLTSTKCAVAAEEKGGAAWTASVQPGGSGYILRLLLLQLRADGQLHFGKVSDKMVVPAVLATPVPSFVGPPLLSVLSIDDKHLDNGRLKVDDIIRNAQQEWTIPRSLQNLHGAGSEYLLRVIGAHLEELHISGEVQPGVMEEVGKLSALKRLSVTCAENVDYPDLPLQLEELTIADITENQLRSVESMVRLRSLEVYGYSGPNLSFPPSRHRRLLWLAVAFAADQKRTMLSLIRANASSVQELRVFCTLSTDKRLGHFYFPELGQELAACGLRALRRLVLERFEGLDNPCTGNVDGCLLQRQTIQHFLPASVDVVCKACQNLEF